ncbi:MAG: hypothetical protein P8P29_06275 [Flavobacteriaceae bacterium]|nr:hypothetical protein [Flavobacteriaceae bacterium]
MKILRPAPLNLAESNVEENDAPLWDNEHSYSYGDEVLRRHKIYVSNTQEENIGIDPLDEDQNLVEARWLFKAPTNRYALLDDLIYTQTQTEGQTIVVELEVTTAFNTIALLNLETSHTTVEIIHGGTSTLVGEIFSGAVPVDNWWDWVNTIFHPLTDRHIFENAIGYAGSIVKLTINGATPKIGHVLIGNSITIGETNQERTRLKKQTYTDITRSAFGDGVVVTKRATARDITYGVSAKVDGFDAIFKSLDELDGIPVVTFVSSELRLLISYGYITHTDIPFDAQNDFKFTIINRGIT